MPERERINVRVKRKHYFGTTAGIEPHDLASIRPCHRPERPVGGKSQAPDTQILVAAEVPELVRRRIENLNAFTGRYIHQAVGRVNGERNGEPVTELVDNGAGSGIKFKERSA